MNRRRILESLLGLSVVATAGCTGDLDESVNEGDDDDVDSDGHELDESSVYDIGGNSVSGEHIVDFEEPHVTEERSVAIEWVFSDDVGIANEYGGVSAGPGELIWVQDIQVTNVGSQAFSFTIPGFFRLVDGDGNEYRPDFVASESPGQLNPGISGSVRLVFQVPQFQGVEVALRIDGQQIFTLEEPRWLYYGEVDLTAR